MELCILKSSFYLVGRNKTCIWLIQQKQKQMNSKWIQNKPENVNKDVFMSLCRWEYLIYEVWQTKTLSSFFFLQKMCSHASSDSSVCWIEFRTQTVNLLYYHWLISPHNNILPKSFESPAAEVIMSTNMNEATWGVGAECLTKHSWAEFPILALIMSCTSGCAAVDGAIIQSMIKGTKCLQTLCPKFIYFCSWVSQGNTLIIIGWHKKSGRS